jgi:peptidyl-tRNA hydrolase ICT1
VSSRLATATMHVAQRTSTSACLYKRLPPKWSCYSEARNTRLLCSAAAAAAAAVGHKDVADLMERYTSKDMEQVRDWASQLRPSDIPVDTMDTRFARSSGPGGQNVNKVNTKADVRFHVDSADWIPAYTRDRLRQLFGNRFNKQGYIVVASDEFRTQKKNLEACLNRIREMLLQASQVPEETSKEQRQHVENL